MFRKIFFASLLLLLSNFAGADYAVTAADEDLVSSRIESVRLFQNQAEITRVSKLSLKKGNNIVVLSGLPDLLHDWSAKGSLPKNFDGKILSFEVEKKALISKRQKNILEIEKKLEILREKDIVFVDELKNFRADEKFLDSILEFTNQTVSRELQTRIPQVKVWDSTLIYVGEKKKAVNANVRRISKEREKLGKEIQKWEFELSQLAGYTYFRNYQTLNKTILDNRVAMNVQQFANSNEQYAEKKTLLEKPTEKVDIEKRLIVNIFSSRDSEVELSFSYVIPGTYWQMQYDFRASRDNRSLDLVVYGNVFQKTGEDWKDVKLSLSTGMPVNFISPSPVIPWYLDVGSTRLSYQGLSGKSESKKAYKQQAYQKADYAADEDVKQSLEEAVISDKGPFVEIAIPLRQSIVSSNKYQKKLIRDFRIKGDDAVRFYYSITPLNERSAYLRVAAKNSTMLPWLNGEAQIFLENEFVGKVSIPYTPLGKDQDIAIGVEGRITGSKELVKKFEDTSGVFGGNRRILYKYRITVENQLPTSSEITITDAIPVSRNEKIKVEIQNLTKEFLKDPVFEKSAEYERGIRKWKLPLDSHKKIEIDYDLVISFDKDITINGLR